MDEGDDDCGNQDRLRMMSMSTAIGRQENSVAAIVGPDRIAELAQGYRAAKALFSAVELGLFTVLAGNPRDLESLRMEIGIADSIPWPSLRAM